MKVYKTKKNKYGWYWVIHVTKEQIKIFMKADKERRKYEQQINVHNEGMELLKKAIWEAKE